MAGLVTKTVIIPNGTGIERSDPHQLVVLRAPAGGTESVSWHDVGIGMVSGATETVSMFAERVGSQEWFWTVEWHDGEQEASDDIAAGRGVFSSNTAEFL